MAVSDSRQKIALALTEHGTTTEGRMSGCLHPIILDGQKLPCNRCIKCSAKRRRNWSFRLGIEMKYCHTAYFITLTYEDNKLPRIHGIPTLHKPDYQKFIKRLRNEQLKKFKQYAHQGQTTDQLKIRYYGVGEYGSNTRRPHYHILLFNLYPSLIDSIAKIWDQGSVHIGKVNPKSINYTLKYMDKQKHAKTDYRSKPFCTMSTKPAIGFQYILLNEKHHLDNQTLKVRSINGNFQIMPKYFREKIFSNKEHRIQLLKDEIEILQIAKLKYIKQLKDKGDFNIQLEISKINDLIRTKQVKETIF